MSCDSQRLNFPAFALPLSDKPWSWQKSKQTSNHGKCSANFYFLFFLKNGWIPISLIFWQIDFKCLFLEIRICFEITFEKSEKLETWILRYIRRGWSFHVAPTGSGTSEQKILFFLESERQICDIYRLIRGKGKKKIWSIFHSWHFWRISWKFCF